MLPSLRRLQSSPRHSRPSLIVDRPPQMFGGMLLNAEVNYDDRFNATGVFGVGWVFGGNARGNEHAGLGQALCFGGASNLRRICWRSRRSLAGIVQLEDRLAIAEHDDVTGRLGDDNGAPPGGRNFVSRS